jgi:hypothetical protein
MEEGKRHNSPRNHLTPKACFTHSLHTIPFVLRAPARVGHTLTYHREIYKRPTTKKSPSSRKVAIGTSGHKRALSIGLQREGTTEAYPTCVTGYLHTTTSPAFLSFTGST